MSMTTLTLPSPGASPVVVSGRFRDRHHAANGGGGSHTSTGPQPARHGELGNCLLCQEPAITHFDTSGAFVGCTEGVEGMRFDLVPVAVASSLAYKEGFVWTYNPAAESDAFIARMEPSDRKTVALFMQAHGRDGVVTREVVHATGLSQGSVSNALNHFKRKGIVIATIANGEEGQ